ncbi:MAG: type II methionyl aminopeptidase [Aigarchaeota archaeon]|nr:type II methionyl aminopeptidase [Aigarchaeota archaeon]MDW8092766.1 type II methionyl aminopeptidase [Nitrososphaerota archaeon]
MLDEESYDAYLQAGRIAREVKQIVLSGVRPNMDALSLCTLVEDEISRRGGRPAFPCNVDVDAVAAHYTPTHRDNFLLGDYSIVKVDFGVEVNGFIVDTAISIPLNNQYASLILATEEALRLAIKSIRAGVRVVEIGAVVHNTLTRHGFKPIRNLTGHEIDRFLLHCGVSIPNVPTSSTSELREGGVYAVEPFGTLQAAAGEVINSATVNIFQVSRNVSARRLKDDELRLLERLREISRGLPYTLRWIGYDNADVHSRLYKKGVVIGYPVLVERTGCPVAQSEHTVIARYEGCEVLT